MAFSAGLESPDARRRAGIAAILAAMTAGVADTAEQTASLRAREVETVPDRILRWALLALAVPGFLHLRDGGTVPFQVASPLYAVLVLIAVVALASPRSMRSKQPRTIWFFVAGGYLALKTTAFLLGAHPAAPFDFIQGYKAYIFLVPLAWFLRRECFTRSGLARTVRLLLPVFALKYATVLAIGGQRPTVWVENNFELMTLIGFFCLTYHHHERRRGLWLALLVAVVFMSESRSALLELCLCLGVMFWRPSSRRFVLYIVTMAITAWGALSIFAARTGSGGLQSTDRYTFLQVFNYDASYWSATEWLVGTFPLTPLSYTSCARLSFYENLFSATSHDVCYSVILHSFLLRAIYDQGVLGLIFLITFVYLILTRSHLTMRERLVVLGIGLANAVSVSAFNSEYMFLVLVIAAGLRGGPATKPLTERSEHAAIGTRLTGVGRRP